LKDHLNRAQHIQETTILNRRFEKKYYHRVQRAIRAEIEAIQRTVWNEGVNAGISQATQMLTITRLPKIVQALYMEVGLRYARRTWRDLQEQKRLANKPKRGVKKSYTVLNKAVIEIKRVEGQWYPVFVEDSPEMEFKGQIVPQTKGFGFNAVWVEEIRKHLFRFLLEKITFQVSNYTREVILNVLNKSIAEGWGVEKTVRELNDLPLSRTQAARIVRTEVTRAANTGAMAAGSTFQYEQSKEWIAANDMRTRGRNPEDHASHVLLDGVTIDYEDEFTDKRNGDKLRYPGDPKASAASVCNCRCTIAVVAKVDERGRLIPKQNTIAA
jgi:hypothetical protein